MKTLGLDIGTTTISAIIYDEARGVMDSHTIKNDSFIEGRSWERLQDPSVIWEKALSLVKDFSKNGDLSAMGLTGQMHGILYLDKNGNPTSPLYTWQDGRGNLPYDEDSTWATHLSRLTGHSICSGYGALTHYYNVANGLVPENSVAFCTIHDYLAMKFSGRKTPVTDSTNAASLGLYNPLNNCFDQEAIQGVGMDISFFPDLCRNPCLGKGLFDFPIFLPIGDNQAAFLGSTGGDTDVLLINMGTGGQVALYSADYIQSDSMETRPFPDGGWLLVGASLCGGKSYALLENFFRETVKMVTGKDISAYDSMMAALDESNPIGDIPQVSTLFLGTRQNPHLRGCISHLTDKNFTPQHLIWGIMQGMADELHSMYRGFLYSGGKSPKKMVGSGNGLRKNPHLRKIFEGTFALPMILSENNEEAACGAAIYALKHCR
ncbi:MAG: hypothetical protein IIW10_02755 [Spirochaetaceae bacterium]|nr:hypothetical protein [Spirochaetaceae bacterium]